MLETKNLIKIYKPKRGVPVVALNDINLKFPKTGMVFILGKSGSGKSTLLNVLGGLDGFTSGDILVKGESTKGFKQQGYDSLRNTYVGFIFQEYNVLDDFTVGANIALAIELQGRKATDEELNDILNKVDLVDYGNRKPNELSGGQKQRVAIARALVKNPEIIMADEPTGALDSVTGKQVFDTLKELSKDKLVLVVSHDREFAETYANRIIELADGKVISDVTKETNHIEKEKQNVSYENNSIKVKHGYQLTEEDRIAINNYLHNLKTDAIISVDNDNNQESDVKFINTNPDNVETDNSGFKLIKSKLSLKNSFKIGTSGLKYKKFKLVMTILLSVVAFTMFGFSDTFASYDIVRTTTQSLVDSKIEYASFTKQDKVKYEYGNGEVQIDYNNVKLDDDDVKEIEEKSGLDFTGVYVPNESLGYGNLFIDSNNENKSKLSALFRNYFNGFAELDNDDLNAYGYSLKGKLPDGSKNEIAISNYSYEYFKETAYMDDNDVISSINKEEDLIGKTLNICEEKYTITGIINTNFNYERYRTLAERDMSEITEAGDLIMYFALLSELEQAVSYSLHDCAFVGKGFINHYKDLKDSTYSSDYYLSGYYENYEKEEWYSIDCNKLSSKEKYNGDVVFFDNNKTSLNEKEILVSSDVIATLLYSTKIDEREIIELFDISKKYDDNGILKDLQSIIDSNNSSEYKWYHDDILLKIAAIRKVNNTSIDEMIETMTQEDYVFNSSSSNYDIACTYFKFLKENHTLITKSYEYVDTVKTSLLNYQDLKDIKFNINIYGTSYIPKSYEGWNIVGIVYDTDNELYSTAILNTNFYNENIFSDGYLRYAVSNMPKEKSKIKKLVEITYKDNEEENYRYYLSNSVTFEIDVASEVLKVLAKVFLAIGITFAIFASLMLSNFIANSISYKKKDIGILRAIGSRSNDVFRIFFAESFVIAMINFVITMGLICSIIAIVNGAIRKEVGLLITLLTIGPRQFILVFCISLLVAAVGTFFPVRKNAKKKPIDAIRDR